MKGIKNNARIDNVAPSRFFHVMSQECLIFLNFQSAENCIYVTVHIWEAGSWNIKFAEHFLIKEEDVGE